MSTARTLRLSSRIATVALLVLSLGTATTLAQSPKTGGTLVIAVTSEATAFDPHYGTGYYSEIAMAFTHERLVTFDADGNTVPLLAKSWDTVDPLTWDFHLQQGVKFQDGSELNADVVAWYFNFSLDPQNETAWRTEVAPVIDQVEAVDQDTVRFHLKQPQASLPVTLASWPTGAGIKSRKAWEDKGKDASLSAPVGTGPFVLEEWRRGDRYIFNRNPDYWQTGLPYVDRVVVRIIPEAAVQLAALTAGEVDIIDAAPRHEVPRLRAEGMQIVSAAGWQQEILWMNNLAAPFDDQRVRLAVAKSIDRQRIVDTLFFGTATVASGGIPPGHWAAAEGLETSTYDPDGARELLAAAGREGGIQVELLTSTRQPELKAEAELIQQMLAEIGVTAGIKVLELGAWWDVVLAEPYTYQLVLGEYSLAPDPHDFLWLNLRSDNQYALSRPQSTELDELLDKGRASSNRDERTAIYRQVQELVDAEAPIVFLLHRDVLRATSPAVRNFSIAGNGYIFATSVWVDR